MSTFIVDGNNLMHRAYHSYKGMNWKGKPVEIIFGVPNMINSLINQFNPTKLIIVWDGKRSEQRLKVLPEYKAGRKLFTPEEKKAFYRQKEVAMKILTHLGIKQYHHMGLEADDHIAMLVFNNPNKKFTIISGDKDFNQLLTSPNVTIYNPNKKKIITKINCEKEFGYKPEHTVDYLSLVGDSSDNITGLKGFGEKTAIKFFNKYPKGVAFVLNSKIPYFKDDKLVTDTWYRNMQIISLKYFYKYHVKGKFKPRVIKKAPEFNLTELGIICQRYNIKTFIKPDFIKNFKKS